MARYLGPTLRKARRYSGVDLETKSASRDFKTKCNVQTRPGQHGQAKKRPTDYGLQLIAKQQLRFKYGLMEKPFRILYKLADKRKGPTGHLLLQLLESRLDNLVFRMGFAVTRREARQLVSHKAILVNGKVVNVPSYQVQPEDEVSIRDKAQKQLRIVDSMQKAKEMDLPDWVDLDAGQFKAVYKRLPEREDLPSDINEQLVVELYSK